MPRPRYAIKNNWGHGTEVIDIRRTMKGARGFIKAYREKHPNNPPTDFKIEKIKKEAA